MRFWLLGSKDEVKTAIEKAFAEVENDIRQNTRFLHEEHDPILPDLWSVPGDQAFARESALAPTTAKIARDHAHSAAVAKRSGREVPACLDRSGYLFTNGKPFTVKAQRSSVRTRSSWLGRFLTMRDYDYFSRVGTAIGVRAVAPQTRITVDDTTSKQRYFDSVISIQRAGRHHASPMPFSANANGASELNTVDCLPLHAVQGYLYMGLNTGVVFSTDWLTASSFAAATATGDVVSMEDEASTSTPRSRAWEFRRVDWFHQHMVVFNNASGAYKTCSSPTGGSTPTSFQELLRPSNFWESSFQTDPHQFDFAPPWGGH